MPDLAFGTGAYARERGNLPELPVVNMFAEASPSSDKGVVLQSRPGLELAQTVGAGPIRGMYSRDGVFGGSLFVVSASYLFRDTAGVGGIDGVGAVSFAASPSKLMVARGLRLFEYNGSTLTPPLVSDPDGLNQHVTAVAHLAGYDVALIADSNKFQFRQYTADSFDGLDFANAENEPDNLRDVLVIDDQLVFLGTETVEFWAKTGDADAPFAPIEGRVFEKGVIDTGAATRFDNSFAWIGNEKIVYIAANVPQRISDAGIEERMAKSAKFALYTYFHEGVEYLVMRLDAGTWVYSAASRQWSEFASFDRDNWRVRCSSKGPLFGDDESGAIYRFSDDHRDVGGPLERRVRAGVPIRGGSLIAASIRATVNVGETPDLTGDYAEPVVELRSSRDAARTWDSWQPVSLGAQGQYRDLVEWRAQGMFDAPGMIVELRCSDPVPFRLSSVSVNEPVGGRSR